MNAVDSKSGVPNSAHEIYMKRLLRLSAEELNVLQRRLRETANRKNGRWMLGLVLAALSAKIGMEVVA